MVASVAQNDYVGNRLSVTATIAAVPPNRSWGALTQLASRKQALRNLLDFRPVCGSVVPNTTTLAPERELWYNATHVLTLHFIPLGRSTRAAFCFIVAEAATDPILAY